jgi:transcriptional regulator with XRE-family HTH domain
MSERGEVLRLVMSQTGTTQSELSRISGVRQPSISQFLSGGTQMSDAMLDRLLSCMGYRLEVVRRPLRVEMDRSGRRSWRLHRQLSSHLDVQTLQEWTPTLRGNLQRLQLSVQGEPHVGNLQRWSHLIERGDLSGIRRVMTGVDVDSTQMREVSPMGGLLSQEERGRVLEAVGR